MTKTITKLLLFFGLFIFKSTQFTYGTIQIISNGMDRYIFPFDDFPGTTEHNLPAISDITHAKIEITWTADQRFYNLDTAFRVICFFRSSASKDFTSQIFEPGLPLEHAFPAAEKVVCHARFNQDVDHEVLLLTVHKNGRLEMRDIPTISEERISDIKPRSLSKMNRTMIKFKVIRVPDPQTTCNLFHKRISNEIASLRLGEEHIRAEEDLIPQIYCFNP